MKSLALAAAVALSLCLLSAGCGKPAVSGGDAAALDQYAAALAAHRALDGIDAAAVYDFNWTASWGAGSEHDVTDYLVMCPGGVNKLAYLDMTQDMVNAGQSYHGLIRRGYLDFDGGYAYAENVPAPDDTSGGAASKQKVQMEDGADYLSDLWLPEVSDLTGAALAQNADGSGTLTADCVALTSHYTVQGTVKLVNINKFSAVIKDGQIISITKEMAADSTNDDGSAMTLHYKTAVAFQNIGKPVTVTLPDLSAYTEVGAN